MEAPQVCVEVHVGAGLPVFSIVGLPEAVVKESKERVRSALATTRFEFPAGRIVVNLAPADLPKEGGRFDLPIALGVLAASEQLPRIQLADCEFYGELSLSGELRAVRGMLPAVCHASRAGHRIVLPSANLAEAALVRDVEAAATAHLLEVCAHVNGTAPLAFVSGGLNHAAALSYPDLAEVRGQNHAKRALEIAAAGGHSLLMVGPPGSGKSMLAHRLPGILPPMTEAEALETATVASLGTRGFRLQDWARRPFRAPHHTASAVALVGGGSHPRPGEISLAHNGVLFLDELPEFPRHVLEVLREPLETGTITISREIPVRSGHEPVSLRIPGRRRRPMSLRARTGRELSIEDLGAAARSHRPARRGAATGFDAFRRERRRRTECFDCGANSRRTRRASAPQRCRKRVPGQQGS
jgi:magnesium chelatase family protein